jgi:hypothetical protein
MINAALGHLRTSVTNTAYLQAIILIQLISMKHTRAMEYGGNRQSLSILKNNYKSQNSNFIIIIQYLCNKKQRL